MELGTGELSAPRTQATWPGYETTWDEAFTLGLDIDCIALNFSIYGLEPRHKVKVHEC